MARSPTSLLDEGPQRVWYGEGTLRFTGRARETVRLVIEVIQGVNTTMVTVAQRDHTLLELSPTSTERLAAGCRHSRRYVDSTHCNGSGGTSDDGSGWVSITRNTRSDRRQFALI